MKSLNLGTAIFGLILSIFLLIVPLITFTAAVGEIASGGSGSATSGFDLFIRALCLVMFALGIVLIVKDNVASKAGKILIIIAGALVVIFSSLVGFVVGIVGASLLLASNKKYDTVKFY